MATNFEGFSKATDITSLDQIAEHLKGQADGANTRVNNAIKTLKETPDNPAALADLQHSINKWSVIYNINSTVTRSFKDLMQGILQKI
jgi:type III secretion protein F